MDHVGNAANTMTNTVNQFNPLTSSTPNQVGANSGLRGIRGVYEYCCKKYYNPIEFIEKAVLTDSAVTVVYWLFLIPSIMVCLGLIPIIIWAIIIFLKYQLTSQANDPSKVHKAVTTARRISTLRKIFWAVISIIFLISAISFLITALVSNNDDNIDAETTVRALTGVGAFITFYLAIASCFMLKISLTGYDPAVRDLERNSGLPHKYF